MSNSEKAQMKTRKANKYLQNLTKEDLPQYHNAANNRDIQTNPSATPHVRIDTTRGPPEDYVQPPEHMNAEFLRDDREDSRRQHHLQQQQQQQPPFRLSPPTGHHILRSPSVEGYYPYPPVFYSPPTYYSPRSGYLPQYFSPQGNFYPPANPQQNPVTIFVSSPTYNPNSPGFSVPSSDSYPSPVQSTDGQYPYHGNRPQQPYPSPGPYMQNVPPPPQSLMSPRHPPPSPSMRPNSRPNSGVGGGGGKKNKNKIKGNELPIISISMIKGHVLEIAVDQTKCRELQHFLKEGGIENGIHYTPMHILQLIFEDVCQHAFTIVVNPFGNYLFQKVYEYSDQQQRAHLLHALLISTRLADASCNKHGSRCVQHMILYSVDSPDLVELIVQALSPHIYRLCVDENGNHVVQYCLDKLSVEQNSFIFNLISQSCLDICKQRYGNRVMQKCIKCAVEGQCADFTGQIVTQAYDLITDEFGNYIVQHMLVTCPHHVDAICRSVVGSITALSKQKHASVVIEKCFQSGSYEVQCLYLEEITHPDHLSMLIQDPFGNYVIQNALKHLTIELKHRFVETLIKFIDLIKQMPWGLQIISKMCSDSPSVSSASLSSPNPNALLVTSVMPTPTDVMPTTSTSSF